MNVLNEKRIEQVQYKLYFCETEGSGFYIFYVNDKCNVSAETVFASKEETERLFDMICEGRVSCEHLADVISDYKHSLIC